MSTSRQFRQIGARVPEFVHRKADDLTRDVRPLGKPRTTKDDLVGALINAATAASALKALNRYDPLLGQALNELDAERQESDA
jgi:hypothetical protein